jgi:hypothetical protein
VLADILLGTRDGRLGASLGGIGAHIFIHVPVTAALEINDHGCELVVHGPIPARVARALITDPTSVLRKVITDPVTGSVLRRRPQEMRPTRRHDRHHPKRGIGPAVRPAAPAPPTTATATTPRNGPTTAPRRPATSAACADIATG